MQGHNEEFPHTEAASTTPTTVMTELLWHCTMVTLQDRDKPIKTSAGKAPSLLTNFHACVSTCWRQVLHVFFSFVVTVVLASCKFHKTHQSPFDCVIPMQTLPILPRS
jgi:hypothetical protein